MRTHVPEKLLAVDFCQHDDSRRVHWSSLLGLSALTR